MDKQLRILLVEDSEEDSLLLIRAIRQGGYEPICERVDTAQAMRKAIAEENWDIIVSDYSMPEFSAPQALKVLKESGLDLPFIVVSGKIGEDQAVAAMKAGAHDYLMKGTLSRLIPAIERELRDAAERSKRRKAENAIRVGKMELEAVIDSVSDMMLLTDPTGRIMRCNKKVCECFNSDYQDILGKNIADLFYGNRHQPINVFASSSPLQAGMEDLRFPNLKGWYNVATCPMHATDKELQGNVHIVKDVTRRKRMEEEKRVNDRELLTLYAIAFRLNSERSSNKIMGDLLFQLHNMLEIDFSSIHLSDDDKLKLKASLGVPRNLEASIKQFLNHAPWVKQVLEGRPFKGKTLDDGMSDDVVANAKELGIHAWCAVPLKIGADVIGVLLVAHRSEKNFSDREVFLLSSIGSQLAVLIENHMLYDRMKEKTLELERSRKALKENLHEVKMANIELERLNKAKNSFIGMASHELKTPITSILGGVQFLLKYSNLEMSNEQREIFTSVHEGIIQLKNLVDDLLSISRIEAKGIVLQKKPVNFVTLSREVFETFSLPLSKRRIQVDIAGVEAPVPADEGFAKLAVRNLLENAIKFTPDGGEISIVGNLVERQHVLDEASVLELFYPGFASMLPETRFFYRLDVSDSGIGIPEEERLRIFEKFYGVGDIAYHSSGKTEFMSKGSGLGLSIVKGIMDAHNGLVWVAEDEERNGSVFTLLFPME